MGAIPTEPEDRRAYFAALGRAGGAAVYKKYGRERMVALGQQGFATTLGRYGGDFVWRLLRDCRVERWRCRHPSP